MSGRLDQSLDSIIDSQKKAKRDVRRRSKPKPVAAAVGGVKKSTKPVRPAIKPATGPAPRAPRGSKVIISGLPHDATEAQIKEYFGNTVDPVKRVALHFHQNGTSRGVAEVIFAKPDSAAKAVKECNGILIDKRPIKIEVVVDASNVPELPKAKSLAERVAANPKAKPKSATAVKANTKDGKKAGNPGKQPRRAKNARPKPKTAEELDAEMTDYWGNNNASAVTTTEAGGATTNGAAAPATSGEDAMEEIS